MSDDFGRCLADVVDDVVIDSLFTGDGANGRRSRSFRLEERYTDEERTVWWDGCPDQQAYERIARYFPKEHIFLSRDGFLPPSLRQTDS
jgi:hypothetical protein